MPTAYWFGFIWRINTHPVGVEYGTIHIYYNVHPSSVHIYLSESCSTICRHFPKKALCTAKICLFPNMSKQVLGIGTKLRDWGQILQRSGSHFRHTSQCFAAPSRHLYFATSRACPLSKWCQLAS